MFSGVLLAAGSNGSWLDPIIIAIILLSVALGILRGLIRSVAGLVGLMLAALFAGRVAALFDPALTEAKHLAPIQPPPITGTIAFVLAFVLIVVAVEVAANMLRFVQKMLFLGWLDRVGGAVFGLVRGVILSMVLLAALAMFDSPAFQSSLRQAQVGVALWQNMSALTGMLPAGIRQRAIDQITGGNLP